MFLWGEVLKWFERHAQRPPETEVHPPTASATKQPRPWSDAILSSKSKVPSLTPATLREFALPPGSEYSEMQRGN